MVLHLPRKRQRLPYHTRTTLTQGAEKAFHMSRQPHLLTSRRMPVRRTAGLVNRQQVGGHNRPLAILRRQRLPQTTRRELITLAGRHPHHLPRAAVQGRPYPPRLLFGTDETPQFIDFHPHLAGFFLREPGSQGVWAYSVLTKRCSQDREIPTTRTMARRLSRSRSRRQMRWCFSSEMG